MNNPAVNGGVQIPVGALFSLDLKLLLEAPLPPGSTRRHTLEGLKKPKKTVFFLQHDFAVV